MSLQILLLIHQCSEDILSAVRWRHKRFRFKRVNFNGKVGGPQLHGLYRGVLVHFDE